MAKEIVAADAPKLGSAPDSTGPTTGGAEIDNLISGLMDADPTTDPPTPVAEPAPEPKAPDTRVPPVTDKTLPFVPPQALGKKEDPKPEDSTVDDDYEPPEVKGDTKAAHAWKSVKQERKQLRDKVKELESALAAKPKTEETRTPEEVAALRQQVTELEQRLGEYDLSSTSSFKQQFEQPILQVVKRGANILVRSGKSSEEANSLMAKITDPSKTMEQIQDLIADEPIAVQGALMTAVGEFSELAERRQEALQHWQDTKAALKDHETRETEVKLVQDVEQNTQVALQKVVEEGNWMYAPGDNPEWNTQVQERVAAAKGILRSASREDLVKYVLEGVTARPLRQMFEETYKLAEQRKAELDRLVGRQPGYRGPSEDPPPRQPGKLEKGKPMEIADAVNSVFEGVESARL
jgi:hypothetical protein